MPRSSARRGAAGRKSLLAGEQPELLARRRRGAGDAPGALPAGTPPGFALGIWSPPHRGEAGGGGGGVCAEEGVARKVPFPYLKVHPAVAQE